MNILFKLRIKKDDSRRRISNFKQDIMNKEWGESIEQLIVERNLEPFEQQDEHTISRFKKYIKNRWGIKVTIEDARWAWNEIVEILKERERLRIEKERLRIEAEKKKREERKKIEKKILRDIKNNNDNIKVLLSIVKNIRDNF